MRRRDVSPEELAKIITLRQSNTSWTQIQRITGIPRRIAQRTYEKRARSQAREELKEARKIVAAEEFRKHLQCLIILAQSLINSLDIPSSPNAVTVANEVLQSLWRRDIVGEYGAYGIHVIDGKRSYHSGTYLRQNLMLFESLQTHTREKVDWRVLEVWESAWDRCSEILPKLREELHNTVLNIVEQNVKVRDWIKIGGGKKDTVERIVNGVLHTLWQNALTGEIGLDTHFAQALSLGNETTQIVCGKQRLAIGLVFTDANLAKEAVDVCNWAGKNLCITMQKDMIALVNDIGIIRESIENLEGMLNPLTLKSMILQTHCDLCPA